MKKVFIPFLLITLLLVAGCSAADPLRDDFYITDIYGQDASFDSVTIGGVPVVPGGGGDVTGPAGASDNHIARYDGVTGKLIQDSNVEIDDWGNLSAAGDLTGFDINALNDVNITNDLDVTDNVDIGGDLTVIGDIEGAVARDVTYVVAASNANAEEKAQADYLCDGTNDNVELQSAVTAASSTGGIVACSSGTFNMRGKVTLAQGVSIIGQHSIGTDGSTAKGTIFSSNDTDYVLYYFNAAGNQPLGIQIRGIKFLHTGSGSKQLIYIDGGQHILFQNLEFHKAPNNAYTSAAIYVANGENYWFRDVYINNTPRSGLFAISVGRITFDNVIFNNVCTGSPGNPWAAALLIIAAEKIDIYNCSFGIASFGHHIRFASVDESRIKDSYFWQAGYGQDGTFDNIRIEVGASGGSIGIIGNTISQGAYANRCNYCINNACDNVMIYENEITDPSNYRGGVINLAGAGATGTYIRNNIGYVTENAGTATITNGNTSVVINHGLSITPTSGNISIVPLENPTNDPGHIWVSNITATQFTINCVNNPGASNLDFGWSYHN